MTFLCPHCRASSEVLSTRSPATQDIIYRRRQCLGTPSHRFTTREIFSAEDAKSSLPPAPIALEEFLQASLNYIRKGTL